MKKIFEDYKRRLTTLNTKLDECKYDITVKEIYRRENLRWKAEVYRTFFHKIERLKAELITQSKGEIVDVVEDVHKFNLN